MKHQILSMMLEDIHNQGERVASQLAVVEQQIADVFPRRGTRSIERVFFVGCGDSFYCGICARWAFQEWAGLWAEPIEALEFRYAVETLPAKSLVIGVSVSGQVERTLACLDLAKEKGALTVGITGTRSSKIYSVADHVIDMGIRVREPGPVPQTVYFLANIVTLYQVALALARANQSVAKEQESRVRDALLRALGQVRGVAERNQHKVMEHVRAGEAPPPLVLIGGGPNWGTAHFGVAKLLEAALALGVVQELEEWAHEQYFLTGPRLPSVLIGAEGKLVDRLAPTARAIRGLGAPLALVIPEGMDVGLDADARWEYPAGVTESLSPILSKVPVELLAYSLAKHLDRRPFDYDNPTRKRIVEETIYRNGESAERVNRRRHRREETASD